MYRPLHLAAAAALLVTAAAPAHAQNGFLFRPPSAQLQLHAGALAPTARSDLFDHFTSELTLARGDFVAPALGATLVMFASDRFDVAVAIEHAVSSSRSEFRDWIGADGLPIQQDTRLRVLPASLTVRYRFVPRGRQLSRHSWLPSRTVPFAGAGAGITWYSLRQSGEFLDVAACQRDPDEGCNIFAAAFDAANHATVWHMLVGAEHWLTARFGFVTEGRYARGRAPLAGQFRGWDDLDLGGFTATFGITVRW